MENKLQNAINAINNLDLNSEAKERLIQQLQASIPNEDTYREKAERMVYNLNKYDACALERTHVRLGETENLKPLIFVWYVYDGRATLATLVYSSWENVFKALDEGGFMKRVEAILSGERGPESVRAVRMYENPLDVVEVIQALATTHLGTGARVITI